MWPQLYLMLFPQRKKRVVFVPCAVRLPRLEEESFVENLCHFQLQLCATL